MFFNILTTGSYILKICKAVIIQINIVNIFDIDLFLMISDNRLITIQAVNKFAIMITE